MTEETLRSILSPNQGSERPVCRRGEEGHFHFFYIPNNILGPRSITKPFSAFEVDTNGAHRFWDTFDSPVEPVSPILGGYAGMRGFQNFSEP
jgi:hypothetical protein